jgi:hypothetical protein
LVPFAFGWLIYGAVRQQWRPLRKVALVSVAAAGVTLAGSLFVAKFSRETQDRQVATFQIKAAAEQFFIGEPLRIFVSYDELIGPNAYVKSVTSRGGEDYHELFPLRCDWEELTLTMGDGRKNILLAGDSYWGVQQTPGGKVVGEPSAVEAYRSLVATRQKNEGVLTTHYAGGRFETTWRAGVPDGPFRAYYADGKLWAEATYVRGAPSGPHVVYNHAGKIIYETDFVPWRRGS